MGSLSSIAQQYLGSQAFDDFCQKFVEQATLGHSGVYPTAIAAWNANAHKAYSGKNGLQPGDLVYFSPNQGNGGAGHTGIYAGNNQFLSATDQGVKYADLDQWQHQTGQQLLGYLPQGQAPSAQQLGGAATAVNQMRQQPRLAQPAQPVQSNPSSVALFQNVWNQTHHTQLPNYI